MQTALLEYLTTWHDGREYLLPVFLEYTSESASPIECFLGTPMPRLVRVFDSDFSNH
jgi:hypothetical protein